MRARRASSIMVALAIPLSILTVVQPAEAHYIKQDGVVGVEGSYCARAWAEISHGTGKGYLKAEIESIRKANPPIYPFECIIDYTKPAGYIRVHPQVWQDGASYDLLCTDWGDLYNTAATWRITFTRTFGAVPRDGGCGGRTDWYGTYMGGWVRMNGKWVGDWIFSGWHTLPTTPGYKQVGLEDRIRSPKPDLPSWVDPETMRVDQDKLPPAMAGQFQNPTDGLPTMEEIMRIPTDGSKVTLG